MQDDINADTDLAVSISRDTMLGDLMAVVIDEIRAAPDVWDRMPQNRQEEVIERVQRRCEVIISEAVRIIATQDRPSIAAEVEQVTFKQGIKAVLKLAKGSERLHDLADSINCAVLIVLPSVSDYKGGTEQVKATPNQASLTLDSVDDGDESQSSEDPGAILDGIKTYSSDVTIAAEVRAAEGKRRAFVITPFHDPTNPAPTKPPFGVWAVNKDDAWRVFSGVIRDAGDRTGYAITPVKKADLDVIGCVNPMDSPSREERAADKPAKVVAEESASHEPVAA